MAVPLAPEIETFLVEGPFAVVGASSDRTKYGNKVLRCYLQHDLPAVAVNPSEKEIEGVPAYASLSEIPQRPRSVSIVTPPPVTDRVVEEAMELEVGYLWMQPGAESDAAVARAREAGLVVVAGGPCLLEVLGFRDV